MHYIYVLLAMLCIAAKHTSAQACGDKARPAPHKAGTFTAGKLAGRNLGDLYAGYIGVRGRVPEKVTVDPARQLDSLWRAKMGCYKPTSVVRKLHQDLLRNYRERRTNITIDMFVAEAEAEVQLVRKHMDWRKLAQSYRLSETELALVKFLALQVSGRDLVAYGLTELMPSSDGRLNVQVLEFLVRNYGKEFVYAIPARHDKYASFGFYQFTSLAVFDNGKRHEGASQASHALRLGNLPSSTKDVRGSLQHRAAYLFAIHNFARLVKQLDAKQRARLKRLPAKNHDDLIQFIAVAHTGPGHAYSAAQRWLDANTKFDFYVSVRYARARQYGVKTKNNLNALRSQQSHDGSLYSNR